MVPIYNNQIEDLNSIYINYCINNSISRFDLLNILPSIHNDVYNDSYNSLSGQELVNLWINNLDFDNIDYDILKLLENKSLNEIYNILHNYLKFPKPFRIMTKGEICSAISNYLIELEYNVDNNKLSRLPKYIQDEYKELEKEVLTLPQDEANNIKAN